MARKSYYRVLQEQLARSEKEPIRGGKTREQLAAEIAEISAALAGPLDNAARIGLAADRKQLRRELEALEVG
jgi:hypothetical protein